MNLVSALEFYDGNVCVHFSEGEPKILSNLEISPHVKEDMRYKREPVFYMRREYKDTFTWHYKDQYNSTVPAMVKHELENIIINIIKN